MAILENPFYHNSIRKIIVAFGTMFDKLSIDRVDGAGQFVQNIKIPLQYFPKEKFIQKINKDTNLDDRSKVNVLPAMGFEMTTLNYAPERKTNTIKRLHQDWENSRTTQSMFNRVPYDFEFSLYIATRKIDDGFRIVEQILPYFTPEFNIKIEDMKEYDIQTNVPFVLRDVDFDMEAGDSFDDRRTILWTLNFTAKGYLYGASNEISLINKTIIDYSNPEQNDFFESYIAYIDPPNASILDDHEIVEEINDYSRFDFVNLVYHGHNLEATLS